MKGCLIKKIVLALLTPIIFSMCGCSSNKHVAADKTMLPEYQVNGDKLLIILKENPSTGYSWKHKMDKQGILRLEMDAYKNSGNEVIVGAGGEHTWGLKGISSGEVVVTFNYYRPWEGEKNSIETKIFKITVGKGGQIDSVE